MRTLSRECPPSFFSTFEFLSYTFVYLKIKENEEKRTKVTDKAFGDFLTLPANAYIRMGNALPRGGTFTFPGCRTVSEP